MQDWSQTPRSSRASGAGTHAPRQPVCCIRVLDRGRTTNSCPGELPLSRSQPCAYLCSQSTLALMNLGHPSSDRRAPGIEAPHPGLITLGPVHRRGHLGWHDPCRPSAFRLGGRRQALRLGIGAAAASTLRHPERASTGGSAPSAGRRALRRPPGRIAAACRGSDRRGLDEVS